MIVLDLLQYTRRGFSPHPPDIVHWHRSHRLCLHSQVKSILTEISPACRCIVLSTALKPALSSISLDASSWTYSDLAPWASCNTLAAAIVAFMPNVSVTLCIMYACTWVAFKALLALTLPLSPLAYPAVCAASVILQPVATSVSTSTVCLSVSCFIPKRTPPVIPPFIGHDFAPRQRTKLRFALLCFAARHTPFDGVCRTLRCAQSTQQNSLVALRTFYLFCQFVAMLTQLSYCHNHARRLGTQRGHTHA